ncbi:hypothetical protein AB5J62_36010 [Amycolatopsis sp. cg5]|uniref:hypothetical protein n=1 Tax=Amycolatopsis sp. cg5 TaxID=3238802 RepID=UPI0035254D5A
MEENDLRAALRAYVTTDEPPVGLAEITVVKAGKRARLRHTFAAIGSAALVVIALVTVGAVVLPRLHTTTPVPVAAKAPCPPNRAEETDEDIRARLTCVVRFILQPYLPADVKLGRDWIGQTWPPGDDPLEIAVERRDYASFNLRLTLTDDQGLGALVMRVREGRPDPWTQADHCEAPYVDCSRRPGPRGGRLDFETLKSPQGTIYRYATFITTDVSVSMISGNALENNFAHHDLKPTRPLPYFDYQQMAEIMTAPDLVY